MPASARTDLDLQDVWKLWSGGGQCLLALSFSAGSPSRLMSVSRWGSPGSAAAIESADVAFTGHDLRLIPLALAHARRGRRIMTGNIALSLGIIVVLFPLALFGVLGLAGVVLVHELAEVIIILNGVRAARRGAPLPATRPRLEEGRRVKGVSGVRVAVVGRTAGV